MIYYSTIFCFMIASILVIIKLLLEHQQDLDSKNGCRQASYLYTMHGMLRSMRKKRKSRREEELIRNIQKRTSKDAVNSYDRQILSVQAFSNPKENKQTK